MRITAVIAFCFAVAGATAAAAADAPAWQGLEPGLDYAELTSPIRAASGDSIIRVLRIDPARWSLELINASADSQPERHTAHDWAAAHGLAAAINASLYQTDYRTSVSLMKSRRHVNNPRLSKHNAVLLFDPLQAGVPPVVLVDRTCRDLAALQDRYAAAVQSIRMISCHRTNVWSQQPRAWSSAAIGVDGAGRVLFIHMRAPLSTHDLADALLALPLDLRETMYVEGGPEAQLYVHAGGREIEVVGSQGSSGFTAIENAAALPIPNIIGVKKR
ncbi:MAG: phosphodiester glycosidase family protein [Deltaproteobacteria bacterium]|nr:phosphodiester glycosidase family protein [Deltaproteobacteria bacterium]